MTKYIIPIIKKKKDKEQKDGMRIPLYKRLPAEIPRPSKRDNKKEKNEDIDPTIVDFNIDGNILEINILVN